MSERVYQRGFDGHTVWALVIRPAVYNAARNEYVENGFICAFKIDEEPRMLDGEYVKENGKPKFFADHMTALCAAFDAARKKIHDSR